MESGQFLHILSSWQVIASCLLLMFLLPLVFFVASARSPVRRPVHARPAAGRGAARKAPAKPPREESESEDDLPPSPRRRPDRGQAPEDDAKEEKKTKK